MTVLAEEAPGACAPVGFGCPVQLMTSMPRWMSSAAMKYVRVPSGLSTILLGGFVAGAVVLGRRLDRGDRPPAALLLAVLASAAVIAVITH